MKPSSSSSNPTQEFNLSDLDRLNQIGAGRTLYKVIHRPTGNIYASQTLQTHSNKLQRQRIMNLRQSLDHPNIEKCHHAFDIGGGDNEIHLLLEYINGGRSLEGTHISDERLLANYAGQILSGLSYLHSRRIAYRDLEPSKIVVGSTGEVKITDVRRIGFQPPCPRGLVSIIRYESPESYSSDPIFTRFYEAGFAADVWKVGLSILELYLGRYPYDEIRYTGGPGGGIPLMGAILGSDPPNAPLTASMEFQDFI